MRIGYRRSSQAYCGPGDLLRKGDRLGGWGRVWGGIMDPSREGFLPLKSGQSMDEGVLGWRFMGYGIRGGSPEEEV